MAPITWKNINAPSLTGAMEAQAKAGEKIASAFDPLQQTLKDAQKTAEANFENTTKQNTLDLEAKLRGATTIDQLNALSNPETLRADLGSMYDQTAVAKAAEAQKGIIREDVLGRARTAANQASNPIEARQIFDRVMAESGTSEGFQAQSAIGFEEKGLPAFQARLTDSIAKNDQTIKDDLKRRYKDRVPTPEEIANDSEAINTMFPKGKFTRDIMDKFQDSQMKELLDHKKYEDTMATWGPEKTAKASLHDKRRDLGLQDIDSRHDSVIRSAEALVAKRNRAIDPTTLKSDNSNIVNEIATRIGGIDKNKIPKFKTELLNLSGGNEGIVNAVLAQTMKNIPENKWLGNDIDQTFKDTARKILGDHVLFQQADTALNEARLAKNTERTAFLNNSLDEYERLFLNGNQDTAATQTLRNAAQQAQQPTSSTQQQTPAARAMGLPVGGNTTQPPAITQLTPAQQIRAAGESLPPQPRDTSTDPTPVNLPEEAANQLRERLRKEQSAIPETEWVTPDTFVEAIKSGLTGSLDSITNRSVSYHVTELGHLLDSMGPAGTALGSITLNFLNTPKAARWSVGKIAKYLHNKLPTLDPSKIQEAADLTRKIASRTKAKARFAVEARPTKKILDTATNFDKPTFLRNPSLGRTQKTRQLLSKFDF